MELGSASSTSPDSPNGLKFGEKVYFEHVGDVGAHHKSTTGSPPVSGGGQPSQSPSTAKKGRGGGLVQGRRCQVEGCETDLSDVKAYYSRHKVCGAHSKSPMVIVAGLEQRFCQQCSRFCVKMAIDRVSQDSGDDRARGELVTGSSIIIDHYYPLYLSSADVPGALSVGIQLIGMENYTLWSRAMEIALLGRNKIGFIDGSVLRSDYDGELKKIWDRCNAIVISWLTCNSIFTLTQGVSTVSNYYTKLENLWDEYDSILPPPSCDCAKAKEYVEQFQYQRLLQFLMGLNDNYSQAIGQILMMHKLPTVNQAYALVIQDESQKGIARNIHKEMESMAMYTGRNKGIDGSSPEGVDSMALYTDECFKLIGYPENWNGKKKVNATVVGAGKSNTDLLKWIVDSGATNHMIGNNLYLKNERLVGKIGKLQLPTGESASVSYIGDFQLNTEDKISDVLCVPTFKFNLLSVNKLTKELNCCVTFFPTCCIFQYLLCGKVKGIGDVEDDLYVLNWKKQKERCKIISAVIKSEDPTIWHKRLGHIPMSVLRRIKEFNNNSSFAIDHCDICPQARQTRIPFPVSSTSSDVVFDLVHMDVWGPYKFHLLIPLLTYKLVLDCNFLGIMETILALLDALSQDLARANVGLEKIDSDVVTMSERLDQIESRRNSRAFTPETLLPMTNPPRTQHNATSQAPNNPQNREQDRPLPPQVDQFQQGGLGSQFSPIQAPQSKLHVTKSSLSTETSLSQNRHIQEEEHGRERHGGYGVYDDAYMTE
ncbi:putative LRR receptor-like serine/threonine-protein kinase-like [Capsicum annuum]|nr:putative LRR receptor-like serine/threonine-protein kinase-like [Capsicum annuum]